MIFQEPLTSLNPMYRVRDQIAEAITVRKQRKNGARDIQGEVMQKVYRRDTVGVPRISLHKKISPELTGEMIKWLNLVRIPDPEQVLERYPFELSGGMSQRVMIAMALSEEPALLIADEPTTALDVTTQAQVLKLMHELMDRVKTSILLVTHDLAVAGQVADRVVVMYAGEIVEEAEVHRLFSDPRHPYTKGLLACIPSGTKEDSALKTIGGSIPNLMEVTNQCKFAPRCPYAFDRCYKHRPELKSIDENRVACFLYDN
jgi:peptide/nickel transport system ATP-binding protein